MKKCWKGSDVNVKMQRLNESVRQEIIKLIPPSVLRDIKCFVFYDNHPRSQERFDITICTRNGHLLEYFHREIIFSLNLNLKQPPKGLRILRNSIANLFYLVTTDDELLIISRKDGKIHKRMSNVDKYSFDDQTCSGQAFLRVFSKDDAVPIVLDDDFNEFTDRDLLFESSISKEVPLITQIKQKLVEATYSVKCNEKTLKEYTDLRQRAALVVYNRTAVSKDAIFKNEENELQAPAVRVSSSSINVCNKKIVIKKQVVNESEVTVHTISIIINSKTNNSLVTTSRTFEKTNKPPFWTERTSLKLLPNSELAVTCIIDIEELKLDKRIDLNGSICYCVKEKEYVLPFEYELPTLACLGDEFDVFGANQYDMQNTMLSILSTTDKIDLKIRRIRTDQNEPEISFQNIFIQTLGMEEIADKLFVYKKSPYHVLYGCMVVINEVSKDHVTEISVYTRSQSQILALIHILYDKIPAKLIITTPNYKLTANKPELSKYNDQINQPNLNYKEYGSSLLKRTNLILEYLDKCLIKMGESKDSKVLDEIGSSIDLLAGGISDFGDFKNSLYEEARRCIEVMHQDNDTAND